MKCLYILMLTVCVTASVFAAPPPPPNLYLRNGSIWDFRSSMLDDFEANLKKMREEFEQLERSLESGFKFNEDGIFVNSPNIFELDPSKAKNESFSDTKIIDDKVVHTEEKVIANGNSVVHFKKVEITPQIDYKPKKKFTPVAVTPKVDGASESGEEKTPKVEDNVINIRKIFTHSTPKDVEEIENVKPLELKAPTITKEAKFDVSNAFTGNEYVSNNDSNGYLSTVVDLSGDTKVNDLVSQNNGASGLILPEPEAEIINTNSNNINDNIPKPKSNIDDDPYYYYYEVGH